MTKLRNLFVVVLLLAAAAVTSGRVHARITAQGASDADIWCVGPSGAEVCVDVSGNLIPTTDNDVTLGTSALRWATGYIVDLTIGDDLTVTGDAAVTGDLTVTSDVLKTPVASAVLGVGGTIGVAGACGGVVRLTVTGNRTTDTTNTFTAPAAANTGCRVDVINDGGGTITLDDNALFDIPGTNNIVLGTGDSAEVVSDGSAWKLIATTDVYDDLAVADDLAVSGDATVTGDLLKTPIASAVLGAGGTIAVTGGCGGVLQLTVTADRTTDTTNTFTAPAAGNTGCRLDVINMGGGTITLDDNALFDVAANIVLGTGDSAEVVSTGAAWLLIGTSDN